MCALDMCYSLNVETVLMCVYILRLLLAMRMLVLWIRTTPVHVFAGHVCCTSLSIMMVLLCIYSVLYKCDYLYKRFVQVHACAGHVCSSLCIMTVHMCVPIYESQYCILRALDICRNLCVYFFLLNHTCYVFKISVVCYVQCILVRSSNILRRNRFFNHFCIQVPG